MFKDDAVGDIFFMQRLLGEQQSFEINGSHWDAVEINGFGVLTQGAVGLAVGVEHKIDNECVGDSDILAFSEPLGFEIFCGLIGQHHERLLEFATGFDGRWHEYVDIRGGTLISMRGQRVTSNEQVYNPMLIKRAQQGFQVI